MPSFTRSRRQGEVLFRRRVPKHLREQCQQGEVVRRITATGRQATVEARGLAALYDQAFALMTKRPSLTLAEAERLARLWFAEVVEDGERRLRATNDPTEIERRRVGLLDDLQSARAWLVDNQWMGASEVADRLIAEAGVAEPAENSAVYRELCRLLLRGLAAGSEIGLARANGDYSATCSDPAFAPLPEAVKAVEPIGVVASGVPAGPIFSEVVKRLVAEKRATRAWDEKSERQARDAYGLFVEHAGDRPVSSYERQEIAGFRDVVLKLPRLRGKAPALTGKTLAELVAAVEAGAEPIAAKSIKRHMAAMSLLFGWAVDQGWRKDNPASRVFRFSRTKAINEEREPWADGQIVTLFDAPIWRGRKTAKSRVEHGKIIQRDAWWWWPVIGLHTGARLGEIAQLRPEDLAEEDGVYRFDIGKTGGRKIKTDSAARRIPLHKTLIDLGLIERRDRMKAEGHRTMWPEMPPAPYGDQQGGAFTRNFGLMVRGIGIAGPTFHGFRHTVTTRLQNRSVSDRIIAKILGHKLPGMGSRYGDRLELDVLAEAINQLVYPVDFLALPAETKGRG